MIYKLLGLLSHNDWVKSITHPCPHCNKPTICRYCSYICGYKAKEEGTNAGTTDDRS